MGARGEMCNLLCEGENASLEDVTPGLSSEEVSLVEKSSLDEGSGNSQGWNGSEGVCTQHTPAARRPWGLGKAVPAIPSRAGEGQGMGQGEMGSLPAPSGQVAPDLSPHPTSFL